MFVPPEHRQSWHPPRPAGKQTKGHETVLLLLIGIFLLSMLIAPIAGSTLVDALLALMSR